VDVIEDGRGYIWGGTFVVPYRIRNYGISCLIVNKFRRLPVCPDRMARYSIPNGCSSGV
jgi:hypothetical protein